MRKPFYLNLVRISATKNSFFFVDCRKCSPDFLVKNQGYQDIREFIKDWSSGARGLSSDGIVFVLSSQEKELDFIWEFYNCDGSSAEMCGNAARAMHLYCARYLNFSGEVLNFGTLAGRIRSRLLKSGEFKVQMPKWKILKDKFSIEFQETTLFPFLINTGVPHFVLEVEDIHNQKYNRLIAKEFRYYKEFGENGANLTFFEVAEKNRINAVTFERGVEDFTESCGTGAVAAAIAYHQRNISKVGNPQKSYSVHVPGGELLVSIDEQSQEAFLSGEAQVNFEVNIPTEINYL